MGFRTFAFLALPVFFGSCTGVHSQGEAVPEDLRRPRLVLPSLTDRHPYGEVTKLRVGQWATYREGDRTFTIAAVERDGDALWIEVIEEGEPRQVVARRVAPDGVVTKAFYGEIGKDGTKSTVEPLRLDQADGAQTTHLAERERETGEERVTIASRELKAHRIRIRREDLEGRLVEETLLYHPDVPPVHSGIEAGGLVRRRAGKSVIELTAFGGEARPQLQLPR
jgi:hypothetical protein